MDVVLWETTALGGQLTELKVMPSKEALLLAAEVRGCWYLPREIIYGINKNVGAYLKAAQEFIQERHLKQGLSRRYWLTKLCVSYTV